MKGECSVLTDPGLLAGETFECVDDGSKHPGWRKVQKLDGTESGYVPGNYIEAQQPARVFEEALPTIMARKSEQGRDVPRFVDDLVDRILKLGGSTTVGIFRWPGADSEVKAICAAYASHRLQRRFSLSMAQA